ncbi:MAG: PorP/SprF family type IX secretion system membrane protein [Flavobacteriales bacterium]
MKKPLLITILGFVSLISSAQDGLPYYNTYLLGDEYLLHPSMAGRSVCGDLSLSVRQQWFGADEHPATYVLSFNKRIGERRGIGAYIMRDENGPTKQTEMQITYNHHLIFNGDEVKSPHRLQMALSAQAILFNYGDLSSLVENSIDPVLANRSSYNFNANMSFTYLKGPFRASLTANSLFNFFSKDDGIEEPINQRNYIGTVEYKLKPSKAISITPSATYILEEEQRRDMFDIGAKFSYGINQDTRLWARASYRAHTDSGFNSLAFTPVVGLDKSSWKISYSYDVDLGQYGSYYRGGHQIRIGIKILCQSVCRCDYDEW